MIDTDIALLLAGNFPAFPCEAIGDRGVPLGHDHVQTSLHTSKFPGMTLRDYFAGQALIGLAMLGGQEHRTPEEDATLAYRHADAMLAERLKGSTDGQP